MALLGTFLQVGALSLGAAGLTCLLHSLPTAPEFVASTVLTSTLTLPFLNSRGATTLVIGNSGPAANHEIMAAVFHTIIR